MTRISTTLAKGWMRLGTRFLPFADAATKELPLGRLLRLSLFQVSTGISIVLLNGTLNRVMIVELGVSTLAGLADGVDAAGVRAVPRADRLQVRQSPLGAGLAARALYLDGHAAAVRRLRHPAVRAAGAVRHRRISGRLRTVRRGAGVPAGRRRHAYDPDRRSRAGDRSRAGRCAAARGRVPLCDAAVRHGRQRADLQRAVAQFQRDPPDPGDPGRRGHADAAQHRGALEAGSAQSLADIGRARAAGIPAILGQVPQVRRLGPRPCRARAGHLGVLDAGHSAGAVWRRNPETQRRPDHGADGVLRARHARGIRSRRKDAGTQRRSLSDRGLRRGGRRLRFLGGDLRRAAWIRCCCSGSAPR